MLGSGYAADWRAPQRRKELVGAAREDGFSEGVLDRIAKTVAGLLVDRGQ